jgi:predicted metal-dependent peptidase
MNEIAVLEKKTLSYEIDESISRLIASQPFYAVLLMDLLKIVQVPGDGFIKTAATDGRRLYIAPEFWRTLSLDERVFLLAHETLHVIFDHCPRAKLYMDRGFGPDLKPFNPQKWNMATDYVINDALIEGRVGKMPSAGLHDRNIGCATDLEDDVYRRIPDPDPNGGAGDQMDQHIPSSGQPDDAPSKAEVQRAVKSAIQAQKSIGPVPIWMERIVSEICEPQVNWPEEIRTVLIPAVGRDDMTWGRPNKRRIALAPHVYLPGKTTYRAGCLVTATDTSGSVSDNEQSHFFGEMAAIADELKPEEMWIMDCSSKASDPELVTSSDDVRGYKTKMGGGTYMPAIFDKLEEVGIVPDALVILTDGETDFGEPPGYDTIWVITNRSIVASHGKTVHIDVHQ